MGEQAYRPERRNVAAAVLAVAAAYVYFLIFAQFGFLQAVRQLTGGVAGVVRPVMAVMGVAGLAGSVSAAAIFSVERSRRSLVAGFAVCGTAAGLAMGPGTMALYYVIALLVGLGAGLTTVTLASVLRRAVGGERLGQVIGLGTGLAYGFCNLPVVFAAGATAQALMGVLAAGAGLVAATALSFNAPAHPPAGGDYTKPGMTAWVLIFLSLVCLDSAAFYIIQHTPDLKAATWSGAGRLEVNAGLHLVAAWLAGYALDRHWVGRTVAIGGGALLLACLSIDQGSRTLAANALLYAAGVSIYSTALVFYPARSLRPWLAAVVYAVAGWGGSAIGIGLAENRPVVPPGLILAAGSVIGLGLLARHLIRRREDTEA